MATVGEVTMQDIKRDLDELRATSNKWWPGGLSRGETL